MADAIITETHTTLQAEVPLSATLHVWLKAVTKDAPGTMAFMLGGDKIGEVSVSNAEEYVFRTFVATSGGALACVYDRTTTAVSVAYFFNAAEVVEKGITVMHTSAANAPAPVPHRTPLYRPRRAPHKPADFPRCRFHRGLRRSRPLGGHQAHRRVRTGPCTAARGSGRLRNVRPNPCAETVGFSTGYQSKKG
jgi:hypothetical protein